LPVSWTAAACGGVGGCGGGWFESPPEFDPLDALSLLCGAEGEEAVESVCLLRSTHPSCLPFPPVHI